MKIRYLLLLMVLLNIGINARASSQKLVVWHKDGSKTVLLLKEVPKTSFSDEGITISTATLNVTYPFEQIVKYTYEDLLTTDISDIQDNDIFVSQKDDNLIIHNLQKNAVAQLYSVNGSLLSSIFPGKDKQTIVSLEGYPPGVYIVKVGNVSYKMMKK